MTSLEPSLGLYPAGDLYPGITTPPPPPVLGTWFSCTAVPGWISKGIDANGVVWKMQNLTGWDEPPDSREIYTPRTTDGSFDALVFDDTRTVSWMGLILAPDRATRQATKLTIGQLAAALKTGADLVGNDEDGPKTVHAKRSPGWKVAPFGPLGLQYQAVVRCVDPYKYGPARTSTTGLPTPGSGGLAFPLFGSTGRLEFGTRGNPGQVTLANPGTADAWPTFTITGPVLGGVVLTDVASGRQIVYTGDVPTSGVLLIIDAAAGRATLNGADRSGLLTVKQWWPVPADGSSTVQFSTLGAPGQTGQLSASVSPTYQ
ncbi:MAG TPA: hypothetical protein VFM01_06675 [Nakamurella sp.]|nr:hypothetical protein [Nakamurella sp.]